MRFEPVESGLHQQGVARQWITDVVTPGLSDERERHRECVEKIPGWIRPLHIVARVQKRQRPRSHSQPKIGTLSFIGKVVPQRSQYDESGLINERQAPDTVSCGGKRCTQTVKKLPITAPYRNMKTTMKAGGKS